MQFGADIDRGTVVRKTDEGLFIVKSWERDGVLTLPLPAPHGAEVGESVLFCEFADGQGVILCGMNDTGKEE